MDVKKVKTVSVGTPRRRSEDSSNVSIQSVKTDGGTQNATNDPRKFDPLMVNFTFLPLVMAHWHLKSQTSEI